MCEADCDGSGAVGFGDLVAMLFAFDDPAPLYDDELAPVLASPLLDVVDPTGAWDEGERGTLVDLSGDEREAPYAIGPWEAPR